MKNKIIEMRKNKIGYKKIAKEVGLGVNEVSKILIENGYIDHVTLPSNDIVCNICTDYKNGLSTRDLEKKYNITRSRITSILLINKVNINKKSYHYNHAKKVNHDYFNKIDSQSKAYILGLLYADGYINEKTYQIELTLKQDDIELIKFVQKELDCSYEIKQRESNLNGKIFKSNRLIIYSKQLTNDLVNLGCHQKKSLTLKFPTEEQVPKELIHHFMRGYFDGDGCICASAFSVIGTIDFLKVFVNNIRNNCSISNAEQWKPCGNATEWRHTSKKDAILIYNYLYKDSQISLKRKEDRFKQLLK